jgi:hypothetical protein
MQLCLCVPGGGLNSRISNWPNAVFNTFGILQDEFRCITLDQRNANAASPLARYQRVMEKRGRPMKGRFWPIAR